MEKIVIVTGGSKGIGNGIIEAYKKNGYRIFSISRTENPHYHDGVEQIKMDLSSSSKVKKVLPAIFKSFDGNNIEKIVLINNAGTLGVVDAVERISSAKIQKTINLNLIAPFLLTSSFIKLTQKYTGIKKVINISSGAANKAYYGWSVYSSSKAALDMMTRAVALEQSYRKNGVKIISIHPGVIDTDMQATIRKVKPGKFKDVKRFIDMKAEGRLADPLEVGAKIYAADADATIENGAIINL